MNNIMKNFSMIAIAILTISIASVTVSCTKNDLLSPTDGNSRKEQLTAPYLDMMNSVNLDTFEVTIISKDEADTYIDFCLDNFSFNAFIAWKISEMSPDSVEVYLIPHMSHYADNFKSKFNAMQNGAKFKNFHDKDKDKVKKWADEQVENGYIVVCYYDEKTKEYYALAYTKLEWALLNLK